MGESERYPISLSAVNIVCFKIDWRDRMLNVLLVKITKKTKYYLS